MSKRIAAVSFAASTVVLCGALQFGGTAWAYPPENPVVEVSNPRPSAGGTTVVSYDGCLPGDTATFILDGVTESVAVGEDGIASVTLEVPDTAGTFTGSVECSSGNSDTFSVEVLAPLPMPTTGSDTFGGIARLGAVAVVVGAGFLVVSRRRRAAAA